MGFEVFGVLRIVQELVVNDVENAGLHNIKLTRKLGGVHLPSLAIRLVEDVFVVTSEGRPLASLHELLDIFILEATVGEVDVSSEISVSANHPCSR